ncbi:unnamed protein product [Brachionus calyciflorus]|uniref:HAT C-terminal dimerisation domain-containing protein n=1 Tax=Brachionus calyciflorus TaxID=104777 RepID=A0A813R053_9BILA|nr:unnamed protein product [Brachionus calyciflorus]
MDDVTKSCHVMDHVPEFIKSQFKDEWLLYLEISSELNKQSLDNFELEKWWLSHKTRLTKMFEVARWFKIPSSSCDSERALSKLKKIIDDTRQNMTELTIKINNFFYFNFTNDFFDESRDSESGEEDIILL